MSGIVQRLVIVVELHSDGSQTSRSWPFTQEEADSLTACLGDPHLENVMTGEQLARTAAHGDLGALVVHGDCDHGCL